MSAAEVLGGQGALAVAVTQRLVEIIAGGDLDAATSVAQAAYNVLWASVTA